ncbi:single-stranded-DNA-specific exonuclease RecJ [Peribacillus frigoritolerans]
MNSDVSLDLHPNKASIIYYSRYYGLHPLLMHHLFLHGMDSQEKIDPFLFPSMGQFHDPFLLNDMKKSVFRIVRAIRNKENILIFGDYDADGITSTSIVFLALKQFGANVSFRLPTREDGYGITAESIEKADQQNISLIITVDNGSSAHDAMTAAKQVGIDIIVTDHHEILGNHPDCYSFINPKREDNTYPFPYLAGAGVAFKLVHALFTVSNKDWEDFFYNYVELAALGTIADLMPLVGENRVLCQFGIKKWNAQPCRPFLHLTRLLKLSHITSATISFSIAPLFNAIGRLSDPNIAVNLLTNSNVIEGDLKILIETNEKRKDLTQQQYVTCESIIQTNKLFNDEVIVVYGDFHHGLIGILASRIAETFVKPAIVINNNGTASCRSVNGSTFSIINSLNHCAQFLIKYGGHQAAAGFSICTDEKHLRDFINALQISAKLGDSLTPIKKYLSILSPEQFTNDIYNDIICLEPFGQQFPQPIFVSPLLSSEGFTINKSEKGHVTFHSNKNDRYFFFNKANIIEEKISSPFRFFYNSTLNNKREFIIHDVNHDF